MKVKQRMTPDPITITPDTTHRQAVALMDKHGIRRLPVVKDGRLIGMVSQSDLVSSAPSKATSLSMYEITTLLDKLTVDRIMTTPVIAVDENCSLAGAANIMLKHRIGALPIVRGEELVGIITETDIFRAFVEVMGGGEPGLQIDLGVADERGQLAAIANALAGVGSNIVSITTFEGEEATHGILSIKEQGADEAAVRKALEELDGVEILEFRMSEQDCEHQFGKSR